MIKYIAGIDVQLSTGCAYYILDSGKKYVKSDWALAAITVYGFKNGRGCELGGKDQLGTMLLPGYLPGWHNLPSDTL